MAYCRICYRNVELLWLTCGCAYCRNCLFEWFVGQLSAFFQADVRLTCPSPNEHHPLRDRDALESCSTPKQLEDMETLLAKFAASRLEDTRACPATSCGYIGWIDSSQYCLQPLKCPKCNTTWKDSSLYPWYATALVALFGFLFGLKSEEGNHMWKWLWTKNCPGCQVAIEKNGGCSNMNCYKCKAAFCWTCLKLRRDHQLGTCMLIYSYSTLSSVLLLMTLLAKLAQIYPEFWYTLSVCAYVFCFLLYAIFLAAAVGVTIETIRYPGSWKTFLALACWWAAMVILTVSVLTSEIGEMFKKHIGSLALLGVQCLSLLLYLRISSSYAVPRHSCRYCSGIVVVRLRKQVSVRHTYKRSETIYTGWLCRQQKPINSEPGLILQASALRALQLQRPQATVSAVLSYSLRPSRLEPFQPSIQSRNAEAESRRVVNRSKVKKVTLVKVGTLVTKKGWFNAGYIFPKGYEAVVEYKGILDPDVKVPYTCSIKAKEGRPWFCLHSSETQQSFAGKSPTACWKQVLDAINASLATLGKGVVRTQVAGPEYFGLNDPKIVEEIESLDPTHLCEEYWAEKENLLQAREAYERENQKPARKRERSRSDSPTGRYDAAITKESFQDNYKGAWSCIERHSRYLKRSNMCGLVIMDDNPLPDFIDPITLQPVECPTVSPYGHVAGYYTWLQVLKESNGICPFTKLPLTAESLTKLTKLNFHRYEKSLILIR